MRRRQHAFGASAVANSIVVVDGVWCPSSLASDAFFSSRCNGFRSVLVARRVGGDSGQEGCAKLHTAFFGGGLHDVVRRGLRRAGMRGFEAGCIAGVGLSSS